MLTIIDKTIKTIPTKINRSIFLAGPCPRDNSESWHADAIEYLKEQDYDGHVIIPLPFICNLNYDEQADWEDIYLNIADIIVFWVPRDLDNLPGFTTNVEFGEWMKSGKVIYARPENAPKTHYLDHKAKKHDVPCISDLYSALDLAIVMLEDNCIRQNGEVCVPRNIWKTKQFQSWYGSLTSVGNVLTSAKVLWDFRVGAKNNPFTFAWILHANVYVRAENRIKANEFVFARPDIACIMAYCPAYGNNILQTKILLIKEFRTPARNAYGYVTELPGGSTFKSGVDVFDMASNELEEETGLKVDPSRIKLTNSRQLVATLSSHTATLFSVQLSEYEWNILANDKSTHGVSGDTELTYIHTMTLFDAMNRNDIDYSMIGMISEVILKRMIE